MRFIITANTNLYLLFLSTTSHEARHELADSKSVPSSSAPFSPRTRGNVGAAFAPDRESGGLSSSGYARSVDHGVHLEPEWEHRRQFPLRGEYDHRDVHVHLRQHDDR